ncbi:MAG TPA: hypothetical protein VGO58_18985 [Chitinophagaceae bacterium]|nr:hypothetical protein [Chitinophagaceae bacterium]
MGPVCYSNAAKKLVLQFILENIDYRKKCAYLQEIISLGKINDTWRQTLSLFFDTQLQYATTRVFSKN